MRPAHIHFIVSADGFEPVTTHLFVEGDEYIRSDAVFGVKKSLIKRFDLIDTAEDASRYDVPQPFYKVEHTFGLAPAKEVQS